MKKTITILLILALITLSAALVSAQQPEGTPGDGWYDVEDYSVFSGMDITFADGRSVHINLDETALDQTTARDLYDLAYDTLMQGRQTLTIHQSFASNGIAPTDFLDQPIPMGDGK